ncbi:MAG TPA: cupredoxin domain-containing protein [Casimicrobiaceae bacterium]|jgi:cytochrome c oxidase subunit 2|nr:cupredoxin domain-containing protein [Casimicrobiaceae bacterium]
MEAARRRLTLALGGLLLGAATIGLRAAAQPEEQVIKILARRFTYTPNKLSLKRGVPVILELTSADVLMGFSAPDFDARADIVPGQVARVRLVPDKVGTFTFLCDIFCGSGHETMSGTITVVA